MFTLELQGLDAVSRQFQRLAAQARAALTEALQAEAERILEASYPLVPVDTGALLTSGRVLARTDGAEIRYGVPGLVDYAIKIHEDTTLNHPNGGTHHFLSAPLFAATGDMPQRLAADMAPRLGT